MRVRPSVVIIIGLCCLALSQEARANRVIANTDVYYDAAQNRMVGYTEATSSYSAGMYYCLSVTVYLTTDGQWAGNSAWDGCLDGYAYTQATLPYDPNAEYSVDGEHTAEPYYRDAFGGLIDYYNFQVYLEGIPVYYPGAYEFYGPGPRRPSAGAILLGTLLALFSEGTRHGPPHHLKVLQDRVVTLSCGSPQRRVDFHVVDSSGRAAGITPIKEQFDSPIIDSCDSGQIIPGACSANYTNLYGKFTDVINVACPFAVTPCGFIIRPNRYQWCPRGRFPVTLATMEYDASDTRVLINGVAQFPNDFHIYP